LLPKLLSDHERIKAAEDRRDSAMHQVRQALGDWYPQVDFTTDGGRTSVRQPNEDTSTDWKNTQELRVTQLLTDFGATSSSVQRARETFERAKAQLEKTRQDVLLEGVAAYLNVIRARERLFYAKKSEDNLKQQAGMEETLVQRGAGVSSDVLQTKSQLAGARANRAGAEGELALAKIRFKTVFKQDLSDEEGETFKLPEAKTMRVPDTLESAIKTALGQNPRIKAAEYDIKISEQDIVARKSKYYPKLNLFAEGNRWMNTLGVEGDRLEAYAGLELTYNFYNGGSDSAAIRAALSNLSEAKNVLTDVNWLVEESARNAWQNHITSKERFTFLESQATIMGEFLELARKERKLGTRSLLDVLTGEVSYINAVSLAVSAKIDTMISAYNLLHAMGQLTMEVFY
jgi:adhesin transport system outer membrane protein